MYLWLANKNRKSVSSERLWGAFLHVFAPSPPSCSCVTAQVSPETIHKNIYLPLLLCKRSTGYIRAWKKNSLTCSGTHRALRDKITNRNKSFIFPPSCLSARKTGLISSLPGLNFNLYLFYHVVQLRDIFVPAQDHKWWHNVYFTALHRSSLCILKHRSGLFPVASAEA